MRLDIGVNQEEYQLWVLLHRTSYAMRRAREYELKEAGVSGIQATVLILIKSAEKPLTIGDITKALFREPHTVSGLLSRMEKQGLIKRVP
ncbi:MAG: helix-turn-helix domain-containing protein, partial [Chloroflexi bacterium]|nr:helix-turn-helix domain-containing protein [Chloroflexota bacterium]